MSINPCDVIATLALAAFGLGAALGYLTLWLYILVLHFSSRSNLTGGRDEWKWLPSLRSARQLTDVKS